MLKIESDMQNLNSVALLVSEILIFELILSSSSFGFYDALNISGHKRRFLQ